MQHNSLGICLDSKNIINLLANVTHFLIYYYFVFAIDSYRKHYDSLNHASLITINKLTIDN